MFPRWQVMPTPFIHLMINSTPGSAGKCKQMWRPVAPFQELPPLRSMPHRCYAQVLEHGNIRTGTAVLSKSG